MKPLLICELGLHGDGDLGYHTRIVDQIVREWSGWPPIAIKVQKWSPAGVWAKRMQQDLGRLPLPCLSHQNLRILSSYCRDRGLLFGCTAHDTESMPVIQAAGVDFVKLGARADRIVLTHALATGLPIVSSMAPSADASVWVHLQCTSAYPANEPWTQEGFGYSCHAVPALAKRFVVAAAPRCHTIEVHVSARPKSVRPLPADMCVSLSVEEFLELAAEVGAIWSARA